MTGSDATNPTEQRGGAPPGDREAREKGPWAARARDGVVPPELGGSDAPEERLADDPELSSGVLGAPASSEAPATEAGIDASGGDQADATTHGGPESPAGGESDLKDVGSGPRQVDAESARSSR